VTIAREVLADAERIDAAEDEIHGEARGDELPEQLRTQGGRRAWLRDAKRHRLDKSPASARFMRLRGVEPPRGCSPHKALNLARLPVPPQALEGPRF
jgi:hypothetical protein